MRVPSVGQPLDERRIVREAYQVAERMLADYRDPPSLDETVLAWVASARQAVRDAYRVIIRG